MEIIYGFGRCRIDIGGKTMDFAVIKMVRTSKEVKDEFLNIDSNYTKKTNKFHIEWEMELLDFNYSEDSQENILAFEYYYSNLVTDDKSFDFYPAYGEGEGSWSDVESSAKFTVLCDYKRIEPLRSDSLLSGQKLILKLKTKSALDINVSSIEVIYKDNISNQWAKYGSGSPMGCPSGYILIENIGNSEEQGVI